jgi:hypothetical protein
MSNECLNPTHGHSSSISWRRMKLPHHGTQVVVTRTGNPTAPDGTSSRGRVGQSVLRCSDRRTSAVPARTTAIPASANRATVSGFPAPAASVDTVPRKSVTVSRALTAAMFSSSHVDGAPVLLRRLYLIRTIFGDILRNCFGVSHRHVPGSTTARSPTPPLCVGSRDDCVSTECGSPVPPTDAPTGQLSPVSASAGRADAARQQSDSRSGRGPGGRLNGGLSLAFSETPT